MTATDPARPLLTLIAAVARDGAIGRGNDLVWREPADLQHLRRITMGGPVLMGRRTWDSLPPRFRPLPGRRNLVLTRDAQWQADGAERIASLDDALARCADAPTLCVIGGAQLYALALPHADRLVLTEIDASYPDADTHFPAWDRADYVETDREHHVGEKTGIPYSFVTYDRRR